MTLQAPRPVQAGHQDGIRIRQTGEPTMVATDTLSAHIDAGRLIPAMTTNEYQGLRGDIEVRGAVLVPLEITRDRVVLDGHHRLKAAIDLGIATVPVRIVSPDDESEHIVVAALHRRQLNASQRAALMLELSDYQGAKQRARKRSRQNLRQHRTPEVATLPPRGKTRDTAAAWAGVSGRTIQDAATVQEHDPALFQQVKDGKLGAAVAARRVRRQLRDAAINPAPPMPEGPFELVYADPPWQLGHPDGPYAPENHYPTMPLEEILALRIPAADDAVLFLWTVSNLLPEALQVIDAWGFVYKTQLVWVKPSIGNGNWVRNRHELLLLATRGKPPLADPELRPDSVIQASRGKHSEKPAQVYELIETGWPQLTKVELFARSSRDGWAPWGNQLPA